MVIETALTDGYSTFYSVKLDELVDHLKAAFPLLAGAIEEVFIDNDDYGVEHYIRIRGQSAEIIIENKRGGMFDPDWNMVCNVRPLSHNHVVVGALRVVVRRHYAEAISGYVADHAKYLNAPLDSALFALCSDEDEEFISDASDLF